MCTMLAGLYWSFTGGGEVISVDLPTIIESKAIKC